MLLKNMGKTKAVVGCGQYNMEIDVGETKEIPGPYVNIFMDRFPELKQVFEEAEKVSPEKPEADVKMKTVSPVVRKARSKKKGGKKCVK